jgi:ABC-type multidrug transport system, ATPase component
MDVILLDYLLRLFALLANIYPYLLVENIKDFLKSSLLKELDPQIAAESLRLFNEYYQEYATAHESADNQATVKALFLTIQQVNKDVSMKQRFMILLRLLLFEKVILRYPVEQSKTYVKFSDILNHLVESFQIRENEYLNCKGFISNKLYNVPDKNRMLIITANAYPEIGVHLVQKHNFQGQLQVLYIESVNTLLFNYKGSQTLLLNNLPIFSDQIYYFTKGSSIKGDGFDPIYYNEVLRIFLANENVNLSVDVSGLEFRFGNSNNGIHELSMCLRSRQLIGIIGRSGVGKSTLINLLIGKIRPKSGMVTINGLDLHLDNSKLDGLIGFVPQDDLLIEELSVFTNLLLNAQLCFSNLSEQELLDKVNNILVELDLYQVRNLTVGTPLNRLLSGGQRKKLNIALELIREPWILYADEPTSGLSSSDSEEIMQLFSEQSSKGRLVVINIHQPSSDIYKLFDKIIVLDREGYPVYFGNPLDAIPYFNDYNQRISTSADYCNVCENVNPEAIFKILEEKKTNQFGEYINERKTLPAEWHQYFLAKSVKNCQNEAAPLPKIEFNKPGLLKQFLIFGKRNILTKLANVQYMSMALLISPLLAFLLASLCRFNNPGETNNTAYIFAQNDNIPSYLFMSVIVALFVGLIISAEEIIRDRKILLRESFLKLSMLGYINSKVVYVFLLSAVQSIMYVAIGNAILGIQGMTFYFWIILFSTSCFANLLGLLISSVFTSVVAIYITVPLIIVPQILLSGVVVNYDKLNKIVSEKEYVPVVGDLMTSRWAYEALIVTQFSANNFQKYYFDVEKQESNIKFNLLFVLPEAKNTLRDLRSIDDKKSRSYRNLLKLLRNEISILRQTDYSSMLSGDNLYTNNFLALESKLEAINDILPKKLDGIAQKKDSITRMLVSRLGSTAKYLEFKNQYYNNNLSDLVLKRKDLESFVKTDNEILRKMEPIYEIPSSNVGRAHFLASSKIFLSLNISTILFNLIAIWIMAAFLYGLLIFFSKFINRQK